MYESNHPEQKDGTMLVDGTVILREECSVLEEILGKQSYIFPAPENRDNHDYLNNIGYKEKVVYL